MIIIKMMGGLGNQMFQFAFYQKLLSLGKCVRVDLTSYKQENANKDKREFELNRFPNITIHECTNAERYKYIDDNMSFFPRLRRKIFGNRTRIIRENIPFEEELLKLDKGYLLGYWTCEKYYEDIVDKLRDCFVFPTPSDERNICMARKISDDLEAVGIHIRRGDYLSERHANRFGNICTIEYYKFAMDYINNNLGSPHFYIFSDDPEYVKVNFKSANVTVIDWNEEGNGIFDLYLMSLCKHNICANSTFSKWAAILNNNPDKVRIMPYKHTQDENYEVDDIKDWWKNWILIKETGEIVSSYC